MVDPIPRLGDLIDDYCPRCRLLLNHAVASLVDGKVVKVVCQTCHSEHPYKHAEVPVKKKKPARATLFGQVLAKAAPDAGEEEAEPAPEEPPSPTPPPTEKKKRVSPPARYISRHKTRPPRGSR